MATNVSYASSDSNLESMLLKCLPDYGEHASGILNTNAITAVLKQKGRYNKIRGGLEAWYGVRTEESSNAKWQGKDDDYNVNSQDPTERLRWDWKIQTNTMVLTELDQARVQGKAQIIEYARDFRDQAMETNANMFNSALWSDGTDSQKPDGIPVIISTTPTTGTVGGQTRSGAKAYQNGHYSTAISDIGSEAGVSKIIELCLKQSVGKSYPDLIVLGAANYAGLAGYLSTKERYRPDDTMKVNDFMVIRIGNILVVGENTELLSSSTNDTINSAYMYGINTKHFTVKQLLNPTTGKNGWSSKFERIGQSMKKAVYFSWFGAFCSNLPYAHFVASSVSTS